MDRLVKWIIMIFAFFIVVLLFLWGWYASELGIFGIFG